MPNERISMSKLKQLIGLQTSNLSVRALSRALGLSVGAVSKYLRAVRAAGVAAAEAETLSEPELERRVFGPMPEGKPGPLVAPDCAWIHGELKRHRHVTLQLLWEEYAGQHGAAAYRRSAFCDHYRRWAKRLKRSMRQRHFAGEKLFIDYAGRTVPIYGRGGEEVFQAHLWVSAMGAGGCAYAEATRTESLPDWLASHVHWSTTGQPRRFLCPTIRRSASHAPIATSRTYNARMQSSPPITARSSSLPGPIARKIKAVLS
jgi:hypothetical protein